MVQFKILSASLLALTELVTAYDFQKPLASSASATAVTPPLLGFGTWNLLTSEDNTTEVVSLAIQTGYRHIDCAAAYRNEAAVGEGIAEGLKKTGLRREDIWVTSKLWNTAHGDAANVSSALAKTVSDLGVGYLDLYLMHWPVGSENNNEDYIETWKSLEQLPATGKVRNIGVANFSPDQLKNLLKQSTIKPAVHQMELHPYLQQTEWIEFHEKHGIHVTAYSPLGNSNPTYHKSTSSSSPSAGSPPPPLLKNQELSQIARTRGCTTAQVALSWGISRGTSVIPKSKHQAYIAENFAAPHCKLVDADLVIIEGVGEKYLTRFNNPSKSWGTKLFQGLDDA